MPRVAVHDRVSKLLQQFQHLWFTSHLWLIPIVPLYLYALCFPFDMKTFIMS
jgi:hypothetical protein